ncbi:MAG TPA: hypothetical protein VGQ83_04930 [Polyangia bacterium]|jgi:hypothetical protein
MYSQTLAEMRAYLDSYMRHAGPLEAALARGEELAPDDRALLCGRLIRLLARLHVGRELLLERRGVADLRFAEALLEQAKAAMRRALAYEPVAEEMDHKIDFRLEQLRYGHVFHEMTGHYHDLLGARTEVEAFVRELPDLTQSVLARDLLTTIDAALKEKTPKLEELWVGPFGRLDDFAAHYPRSHWWWFKR